ncbi:MAG: ferredoxin--NADP reductase [Phycisphaerales bacterium]|nr:MAG: ferredoxin--NADP reductase [Phycisphaerales bacterium]
MGGKELNALVTQRIEHAPGLVTLRVIPDGWELPDFTPGQFTVLGLPASAPREPTSDPEPPPAKPDKMIVRAYSISSSSKSKEYLEFYISLVRSGELTPRIFNLTIGDRVYLSPKFRGFFTLENVPADKNVVLVATGTGLAPYMSMIRSELNRESRRKFAVIHGAYHSWDLGYYRELAGLERCSSNFTYFPIISEPQEEPGGWTGRAGFVQKVWTGGELAEVWGKQPTPEDTDVYLCGHPDMIEDFEKILQAEGFTEHTRKQPGQYHLERYW